MHCPSPPVVSVVLPAYNAAGTLDRAIASIRGQHFDAWELLVIDDGSTDRTRALVEEHVAADARIKLMAQPHAGLVSALNAGLAVAAGEFVARMDADDESYPSGWANRLDFCTRLHESG